jgi:dihydrofolate reductase
MTISLVAAAGNNNVIGTHNTLPWKMPADMKFFMNLTMGHPVIMGRKTYESFGKPLKNRRNIIITRDTKLTLPECEVVHSLEDALQLVKDEKEEIFIIGGAEIYRQSMGLADKIYLTRIYHDFEGDAYFPPIHDTEWKEVSNRVQTVDEKNPYPFAFLEYIKV